METLTFLAPSPTPGLRNVSVSYSEVLAHPERYYQGADIVWVMISAALVFLMVPSLSLIYAGLGNRTFALTLFRLPMITCALIGFQWVLWGYSLAFTRSSLRPSWWGGETRANGLRDVLARPIATGDGGDGPYIPELVYVLYEGMFASFTAALVCGGTMNRVPPGRFLAFISLWSVLVYIPVARWSWDKDGWSSLLGTMDFAGGTPVHIVSGSTVAAFAIFYAIEIRTSKEDFSAAAQAYLMALVKRYTAVPVAIMRYTKNAYLKRVRGKRIPTSTKKKTQANHERRPVALVVEFEPYNINYLTLGTALLWFGWAGFNGGSALAGNLRAVSAWTSTHVAACAGGVTGVFIIWVRKFASWFIDWAQDKFGAPRAARPVLTTAQEKAFLFQNMTILFFCDGAVAGLVAITPGAGFVPVWSASIFGVVATVFVHFLRAETAILFKYDQLQVFALHAGGGWIGMLLTGLLADPITIGLDGHSTLPMPQYTMGQRVGYQLLDAFAGILYTFITTFLLLYLMKAAVYIARNVIGRKPVGWWETTGFVEGLSRHDSLELIEIQRLPQRSQTQRGPPPPARGTQQSPPAGQHHPPNESRAAAPAPASLLGPTSSLGGGTARLQSDNSSQPDFGPAA